MTTDPDTFDPSELTGTLWKCKWPLCWELLIQWIGYGRPDPYMIFSLPTMGAYGVPCMCPHSQRDGSSIHTGKRILELLKEMGATRIEDKQIAVIDFPGSRASGVEG